MVSEPQSGGRPQLASTLPPVRPPLRLAWQQRVGDMAPSVPPVAEGEIVVGRGGGTIGAYRALDGEPLWRVDVGSAEDDTVLGRSDEGVVAAYAETDGTSAVTALDCGTGERRWTAHLPGGPMKQGLSTAATAIRVLTTDAAQVLLHDLDPRTGRLRSSIPVPPTCERVLARERHTLLGARDLLGDAGGLYRLLDGAQTPDRIDRAGVWSLDRGAVADVASVGNYGSEDRYVLAVDPDSGEPRWRCDAVTGLVAVDGNDVACMEEGEGDEQVLVLRDAHSGDELWRAAPEEFLYAGHMFFTGDAVGVVDLDGAWFADRATGRKLGRTPLEHLGSGGVCVRPPGLVFDHRDGLVCLRAE
jgi:hypothetical protein